MAQSRSRNSRRRATRQRAAISEALDGARGFRTAQELHDQLRRKGERVGLTTVYRALQAMVGDGDIDVVRSSDGEAMYRRCRSDVHHHHLVCTACGASVEVSSAALEEWARRTARRHGFTSVTHTAELYGICRTCGA